MTKPREKTREELTAEIEGGKKKIRQLENHEKVLRTLKNAHHNLIPGSKSYTVEINTPGFEQMLPHRLLHCGFHSIGLKIHQTFRKMPDPAGLSEVEQDLPLH